MYTIQQHVQDLVKTTPLTLLIKNKIQPSPCHVSIKLTLTTIKVYKYYLPGIGYFNTSTLTVCDITERL